MRVLRPDVVAPLPRNCRRSSIGKSCPRTFASPFTQLLAPGMRVTTAGIPQHLAGLLARHQKRLAAHAKRHAHPFLARRWPPATLPAATVRLRFSSSLSNSNGRSRKLRRLVSVPLSRARHTASAACAFSTSACADTGFTK